MKYYILLLTAFTFSFATKAQPANDDCINAIGLIPSSTTSCSSVTGSNSGVVTTDYDGCREYSKRNVWYKFTASATTHIVRVNYGTITNGIVDVYTGNCGSLTNIETCKSEVTGPVNETILSGLIVGQEYKIAVSTREQANEGSFDICVFTPTAPANDECSSAVSLTVNNSNVPVLRTSGSSLFATQSLAACTGTADDDVWYSFMATQSTHRIHLFYSNTTFSVEAFSGTCGALVSIACATPGGILKTMPLTGLTPGQVYFIRIYSTNSSANTQGSFQLAITSLPQNDECVNALTVVPSSNGSDACVASVSGATFDATQSSLDCFGSNSTSNDTWFRFTASQSVHKIKVFGFGNNVVRFQVMGGDCASLASLFCQLPTFSGDTASALVGGLTVGQNYLIRVYSGNSGGVEGLFNLCVTSPVFPPNDECSSAVSLIPSSDSTLNFINATTNGATSVTVGGSCSPDGKDIWFRFTATSTQHVLNAFNLTNNSSLTVEWFSGTCGSLVHRRCGIAGDTLFGMGNLTIGETYFIRVYNSSFLFGDDIKIALFTPQALSNDECANAIAIVPTGDATCEEIAGTNLGATQSINDNCDGNVHIGNIRDVWYRFTATSASHRIRLIRGTGESLRFKFYTGSCNGLVEISCSVRNTSSIIEAGIEQRFDGLTIGQTYFVRVFNTAPEVAGTFDLCIRTVVIPVNNECATPTILTPQSKITFGTFIPGTTTDATQSAQATICSTGQDDDVWYQFTATKATMQVLLQNSTISTTRLVVYSGDCSALVLVKCQLGNTRDNLVPLTGLTVGNAYLVRVYSSTVSSGQGSFSIMVTEQYNPPSNDDCVNATELIPSAGNNFVATRGSTIDAGASGNATCVNGNDVWFRFVATAISHRVNIEGFVNTPFVTVFSGSCTGLVQVPSSCAGGSLQVSVTANSLTIGNTYFIKVLSNSTAAFGQSFFNISINTPQVPVNNECVGAIVLPIDSDANTEATQLYTTNLATFNASFNCPITANDVWFSFVAPAEPVTIEVQALNTNAAIELLRGSCGSLTSVSCNGTTVNNLNNIVNANSLIAGNTYFIRVSGSSSVPLEFKIKLYKNLSQKINTQIDSTCLFNNLVLNPGLENDLFIPTSFIGAANPGAQFISGWRLPTRGTADFFNAINAPGSAVELPNNICFGNQSPRNGYGYGGIFAYTSASSNYREYLESQLNMPMTVGKKYLVSMYVSLSDFSTIAIDNLGIALRTSQTRELRVSNLSVTPVVVSPDNLFLSDKKSWVNISAVITADQPYQYLLIGNFKNNASTDTLRLTDTSSVLSGGSFAGCASISHSAYYFVDDVVVSEINEAAGPQCLLSSVPLKFLSFTGKKIQEQARLEWKTTNEKGTSHFEIQRSNGGNNFVSVGKIASTNRSGINHYSFIDEHPLPQNNYYRLRQVDEDGKFTFSPIVKLDFSRNIQLITYTNPFNNYLSLRLSDEFAGAQLSIHSIEGKLVWQQKVTETMVRIEASKWTAGIYVLKLTKDGTQVNYKLVKQ